MTTEANQSGGQQQQGQQQQQQDNANANQNNGQGDQTANTDQNNAQNNIDAMNDFWQNPDNQNATPGEPAQNITVQQLPAEPTASDKLESHIDGLQFTADIDFNKLTQDMREGNTESLEAAFKQNSAKVYKSAVSDMNRLTDSKIQKAVDAAVNKSRGEFKSSSAIDKMHDELKFTSNKAIEPIATAALTQAMKGGKDLNSAIKHVKEFFQHMHNMSAGDLDIQTPPNNGGPGNSDQNDETNWDDIFGTAE